MSLFTRSAKHKVLQDDIIAQKVGQRPGFLFVPQRDTAAPVFNLVRRTRVLGKRIF